MQIILIEDVQGLGYKNDIVTVKDGYGRNYLIPQHKAIVATESAKKILAENLKQRAHKLAAIKKAAEELAARIEPLSLTILPRSARLVPFMLLSAPLRWLLRSTSRATK